MSEKPKENKSLIDENIHAYAVIDKDDYDHKGANRQSDIKKRPGSIETVEDEQERVRYSNESVVNEGYSLETSNPSIMNSNLDPYNQS